MIPASGYGKTGLYERGIRLSKINKAYYDIIVAGGGASGMTAACFASPFGSVCVLEKNGKPGRKLAATGNGKCNMTNEDMDSSHYHSSDPAFVEKLLKEYDVKKLLAWFEKIGIKTVSKNGYIYPMSEQAKSVSETLEREMKNCGAELKTGIEVERVTKENGLFSVTCIDEEKHEVVFTCKRLILALGGPASVYGGSNKGLEILKTFGHRINPVKPALVAVSTTDKILKKLAGVRLQAAVKLEKQGEEHNCSGEIIFNDGSVSGIPVMILSRYVAVKPCQSRLILDLLPELKTEEAIEFIISLARHDPHITYEELFRGILHYKAVYYIFEKNGIKSETPVGRLNYSMAGRLVNCFKSFSVELSGTKTFDAAQTHTGGLDLSEVDNETLESRRVKGLYITGELLDADGDCGGYNLHFAFATGMKISGMGAINDQD